MDDILKNIQEEFNDILKKIQEEFKKGDSLNPSKIDSNSFQPQHKKRGESYPEIFIDLCKNLEKYLSEEFPRINKESSKKSLIIETRILPHTGFVIKNTIQKLGDGWGHIIYCHLNNYDQIKSICSSISSEIEIRVLEKELTRNSYNSLLLDIEFWNDIDCEKVLIYQTDSFIFKEFDDSFLDWDYIGAPWGPSEHSKLISKLCNLGYELNLGNGGFSLRTVEAMKDAILKIGPEKNYFGSDTDFLYEDVFFSKFIYESPIWKISPLEISNKFSFENKFLGETFACHQPWDKDYSSFGVFEKFIQKIKGVNVYGFGKIHSGLSHNMESVVRSLEIFKIPYNSNIIDPRSENGDFSPVGNDYFQTNIFAYNPDLDGYKSVISKMGGKYNIAIWAWELEVLPENWIKSMRFFDEIWVISKFVYDCLKKYDPEKEIKIINIPGRFKEKKDKLESKKKLGLEGRFITLFTFDSFSDLERKNPKGLISAFNRSLSHFRDCVLIIKTRNLGENEMKYFGDLPENIILVNETWDEEKMGILFNSSDLYCSLHRSEGSGLTIMEAIHLEIPIVCTNWSGNLDFCLEDCCELVDFKKIEVPKNSVYRSFMGEEYAEWADPSIEDASDKLLEIYKNYDFYLEKIKKNKEFIEKKYNLNSLGEFIKSRIFGN